ncbi:hypothetical protein Poly30_14180 [Planctomycetes bacterium Poly30]|uniref:Uncharacterized protein n=1 Tax=Saltatorellus ferox TaxID=2528018 RepID=A0A518EPA5_9BACT|nr:hypothetical protein Poly30_14180 [Planctomycetes bacterium Poly30]
MQRTILPLLSAPLCALMLSTSALAQAPSVAIVAAANTGLSDCRYTDVQAYLQATGSFLAVDVVDCTSTTPTLTDLASYDSVLTWSNTDYFDKDALGDVFADYADAGGGVVVAVFANTTTGTNRFLGGRWATGGYEIILPAQGNTSNSSSLGTILDPTHPLVQGVTSISASSAFRPLVGTPILQGTVIAEWADGAAMAVAGAASNRVDLGLYPPSSNCSSGFWDFTGDGDVLVANALLFVAGGGSVGSNYCTANANSTGVSARIGASGSNVAVTNDLTLEASDLPAFSFAFFITSQTQTFVMNPAGSAGNLCVGGAVGRYVGPGQIQQAGTAGTISLGLDLAMTPQPNGFVSIAAGETWNFQAWYRDAVGGTPTSNFTDGYSVLFQ